MVVSRPDPASSILVRERTALVRYAMRLTADRADAEDLVQQAWLRFLSADRRDMPARPAHYLRRIVRNLAIDDGRHRARRARFENAEPQQTAEQVASDRPSALTELIVRDDLRIVRETVAAMPERTRRAFECHRLERLTLVEIAERLGISKSLAQTLVIDALERCKQALKDVH